MNAQASAKAPRRELRLPLSSFGNLGAAGRHSPYYATGWLCGHSLATAHAEPHHDSDDYRNCGNYDQDDKSGADAFPFPVFRHVAIFPIYGWMREKGIE